MKTILYLIRHGATEANLARPPVLQGRSHNPPLAPLGIRQAEAMGEFALSETLRRIITQEQEHEIDLANALGIPVPAPKKSPDRKFTDFVSPGRVIKPVTK